MKLTVWAVVWFFAGWVFAELTKKADQGAKDPYRNHGVLWVVAWFVSLALIWSALCYTALTP